jgi:hypothetical protein
MCNVFPFRQKRCAFNGKAMSRFSVTDQYGSSVKFLKLQFYPEMTFYCPRYEDPSTNINRSTNAVR